MLSTLKCPSCSAVNPWYEPRFVSIFSFSMIRCISIAVSFMAVIIGLFIYFIPQIYPTPISFSKNCNYSISRQFGHGSLLCIYAGDSAWHECSKSCSFSLYPSSPSGYLEFKINDSDQGNNSGAFKLDIKVTGR